jgi:uncharacterized protein YcbK (DUF882 family)
MLRIRVLFSFVVAVVAAQPLVGQSAPGSGAGVSSPPVLGIPAVPAGGAAEMERDVASYGTVGAAGAVSMVDSRGGAVAPGVGRGISGALRVVIAPPGERLDPSHLPVWPGRWEEGHRWAAVHAPAGPAVLGEPTVEEDEASHDLVPGEIRTPVEPGVWRLRDADVGEVFVITQTPASGQRGTHLNGYHIGIYPTAGSGRSDGYAPPSGFIEVTPQNRDLRISENFTLGEFVTKDQFDVWPKYVALDPRLLDKLELVLQELNAMGIRADRMHVMSGFRTPQYNGPGGDGRAALSRHMWGDAADVWVDGLGDGRMDDLNGDGRVDHDDATVILRAVERVERRYPELIGGAGTYPGNEVRGPYIHIDVRGAHSRW